MKRRSKQRFAKIFRLGKIGVLVFTPIFLLAMPKDYFDSGKPAFSLFEMLGVDGYYSKGLTRGCMHLLHLDFEGAASFNKLSFVVVPLLLGLWGMWTYQEIKKYQKLQNSLVSQDSQHLQGSVPGEIVEGEKWQVRDNDQASQDSQTLKEAQDEQG
jgi:hypothetical protein